MKTLFWKRRRPRPEEEERLKKQTRLVAGMLKAVSLIVVPLLIYFIYFTVNFRGISSPGVLDTAQLARGLMEGKGFSTRVISPVVLNFFRGDLLHYPELVRAPLYPWILSRFFLLMGDNELVIPFCSGIFFLACSLLTLRLGYLFGGKRTALISFFLVAASPALLQAGLAGSRFLCLGLIILGIFWALNRFDDYGWLQPLICGMLSGAAFLIDYAYLTVLLVLIGKYLVDKKHRRIRPVFILILFFLVIIFPWLFRNSALTGNPFFSLQYYEYKLYTATFPGYTFFRSVGNRIYELDTSPADIITKFFDNLPRLYLGLLIFSQSFIFIFYLADIFWVSGKKRITRNLLLLPPIIILIFLYISITTLDLRQFVPLIPLVAIGAARFFVRWLEKKPGISSRAFILLSSGFIVFNSLITMQRLFSSPPPKETGTEAAVETLIELVGPEEIVVSDNPWRVAWEAERTAIWIPVTLTGLNQLVSWDSSIRFLYLTPRVLDYPVHEEAKIWQEIFVNRRLPVRTPFDMVLPLPGQRLIFGESKILENRLREE